MCGLLFALQLLNSHLELFNNLVFLDIKFYHLVSFMLRFVHLLDQLLLFALAGLQEVRHLRILFNKLGGQYLWCTALQSHERLLAGA